MQEPSSLGRIVELVRDLRRRCSWDAKQTPQTLRPYLVEEVMELDHALIEGDPDEIRVELGDMLLHLAFQIVLAEEAGQFGAEDVTRTIEKKMHRRHPHLFHGEDAPETWEKQKQKEARAEASVLDGLPPRLQPLLMAYRLQERAAGVGFDWPDIEGPLHKICEEAREMAEAVERADRDAMEDELGDMMFSLINLSRKLVIDPRAALERANKKFSERFRAVENAARERGIDLARSDLAALDQLWDEVKDRPS